MSRYKKSQYARQEELIRTSDIFTGDRGGGKFRGHSKSLGCYYGSAYYQEPFYQLMRQTLWVENIISHCKDERLKADDYMHIHVIPNENRTLLDKKYCSTGKGMEETWRSMLCDQSKYIVIDPKTLFAPVADKYSRLAAYLQERYW